MQRITEPNELRALCDRERAQGRTIGFVPTMGFLHEGHLALMDHARETTDFVVVSIFVNPTQFCAGEDLSRYPRDAAGDAQKCEQRGVSCLFLPSATAVYGPRHQTYVEVGQLTEGLCGAFRPGHFRGVCTVVAKLFNVVGPCRAVFGEKDYQQLQVIRRMTADLDLPVQVVGRPTVRESDGLAKSSRNAYLSLEERKRAPGLYAALCHGRDLAATDTTLTVRELEARVREHVLDNLGAETRIDYIEARDAESLAARERVADSPLVLAAAVYVGTTRLIDNVVCGTFARPPAAEARDNAVAKK